MNTKALSNAPFLMTGAFWAIAFLFSLVLFKISKDKQPTLLAQFLFVVDFAVFTMLASETANPTFFWFLIPASFSTLEVLKGQGIHVAIHFAVFFASLIFLWAKDYMTVLGISFLAPDTKSVLGVIFACLFCRGIVNGVEKQQAAQPAVKSVAVPEPEEKNLVSKDTDKDEQYKKAMEETIAKLQKKLFEIQTERIKGASNPRLADPTDRITNKYKRTISGIAGYYNAFISSLHHSKNLTASEEIRDVMGTLATACGAGFAGLFTIKDGELRLANYSNRMGITDIAGLIQTKDILHGIQNATVNVQNIVQEYENGVSAQFPNIHTVLYVPYEIYGRKSITFLCFSKMEKEMLPHYCNLAVLGTKHVSELYLR